MSGVYHATNLQLISRCCAYALQLQEDGVPMDRRIFQVGIATHAVLEAVGLCANELGRELTEKEVKVSALGVCDRLMSTGRSYDGVSEPPMAPEDVFAGQELALNWLLGVEPAQPGAMLEQGLGLDADGAPTEYWKGSGLTIRTILDSVRIVEEADEESARRVLIVRDWKSAWSTDADELETLQRRIQAIAAWRYFGPADVLRLEVVNLRLQKVYAKDLYREDGLDAQIAEWWRQVAATVRALEAQRKLGKRPAAPGFGCLRCPYISACAHAQDFLERRGMHNTPEKRAQAYVVAAAMREELGAQLRIDANEQPVKIDGGFVGTTAKERTKLRADGYQLLWERWEEHGGDELGFAKALKLTASNAKEMAKTLYFDRKAKADRDALIAEVTEPELVREFGVFSAEQE